ncbi:MAG: polyphosphate kinase 2 family protein [Verrucomicrobiota bacterium JB022]|nr:polyphosphate kinase 2 family protein [Verrucomicrobiota bacterium JB022]
MVSPESLYERVADQCVLPVGQRPDLIKWTSHLADDVVGEKEAGVAYLHQLSSDLAELQRRLHAAKQHKLLIILQGMDTSGKGGTVRHVFRMVNPMGVNVAAFDKPTVKELSYDYLWRVHARVPAKGEIAIFDRSHYEDIVTVRVHDLFPQEIWERRYRHIAEFEQMLADEGTTVLKFFLHISKEEQKSRLKSRLEDPEKYWKFDPSDIRAREHWEDYMDAYADVMERCNAKHAPWYIIPADRKWVRNILVAEVVVRRLRQLEIEFPAARFDLDSVDLD